MPVTRAAIMLDDNRLPYTAEAMEGLLARLVLGVRPSILPPVQARCRPPHAEATIKQVQRMLAAAAIVPVPRTAACVSRQQRPSRAFEEDQDGPRADFSRCRLPAAEQRDR